MEKTQLVKVRNRNNGVSGYMLPELGVNRQFQPKETKEIEFQELEKLSWLPGGMNLIQNYLIIEDKEARKLILPNVAPEYNYTETEITKLLTGTGKKNMDQFLDCLDFAPAGVLELVKEIAVNLPITDTEKMAAIQEKLGFNVANAISIKKEMEEDKPAPAKKVRRSEPVKEEAAAPKRRYEVVEEE